MGRSSSSQTQTTTSAPPSFIAPYLQGAAGMAHNQYHGNFQSPDTLAAQQLVRNRVHMGSPVNNAAQQYATKTLTGGFMGSNPWLDQTFNRAAGAVTNQVQSNFGVAGRDPRGIDAAGFAGDQYNDLAAQIYGGDYQAERQRQQQLVGMAPTLANQAYVDAGELAAIGAQNDPGTRLDDYIARLNNLTGGFGTTTSSIPMQRNRLAGLLGGGLAGAGALGTLGLGLSNPIGWGVLGGSALLGALG